MAEVTHWRNEPTSVISKRFDRLGAVDQSREYGEFLRCARAMVAVAHRKITTN